MTIKLLDYNYTELDLRVEKFPGGELNIKLKEADLEHKSHLIIEAMVTSSDDVMAILMVKDAIDRYRDFKNRKIDKVSLHLPYLPYARQDRVCNVGEAFSLKVFANLINSCNFYEVEVLDPHSDVGPALLNDCQVLSNFTLVESALLPFGIKVMGSHGYGYNKFNLVAPDAGAAKKIGSLATDLKAVPYMSDFNVVQCMKKRNVTTGKLSGFSVPDDIDVTLPTVIVDDIIDGGGTFLGLAKEFSKKGVEKLFLIGTHGIFSQGFGTLCNEFEGVAYTDSFKEHKIMYINQYEFCHNTYSMKSGTKVKV